MIVGAIGAGKTTMINRMINHLFDVNYTDPFRFQLMTDEMEESEISQTTDIHKYTINHKSYSYKLTIIDTPGICSTTGKNEDKNTLEKIRYLFESGIVEAINAVCIVEKYNTPRLTENQIYIFTMIAKMFGSDVCDVIVVMATFCDDIYGDTAIPKRPKVLKMLEEQQIPFKTHYLFNNKDIYAKPITSTRSLKGQVETANWDTSTDAFKRFFETLEATVPISLKLTRDILQKKYNIKTVKLPHLVRTLRSSIHEIETLEQDRRIIEDMIENPDTSDYTIEKTVAQPVMVDIKEPNCFSTWCKKCNKVCHYPCDIEKSDDTWWCSAMTWFNLQLSIHCTVCQGQCLWRDHIQIKKKETFQYRTEKVTIRTLKERYMRDMKAAIKIGKETCEDKMKATYKKLLNDFKEIQQCIDYINKNSLRKDSVNIKEFIDDVIETEQVEQEGGYKQRIHCLNRLVQMKNEDMPADEVQEAITFIQSMQIKEM